MATLHHDDTNPAHATVIGIGCRLPGGIRGPLHLWQALLEGRDAIGTYPQQRWEKVVGLLAEQDRPSEPWTAGVLEDLEAFDHDFFGVPAAEAQRWDPLQRHLMEVVVESLYDSGIPLSRLGDHRVGVYVGSASVEAPARVFAPHARPDITEIVGAGPGMLAAPLAHWLDLRGPVRTIDTACSSTGTAVHEARRALQLGEVDLALVAGASSVANPVVTRAFSGSALSPDGRCKPFDDSADGYGRAEGVAAVVLRRAADAQNAGDRAYGRIVGSYLNHDGNRTSAIGIPSTTAQVELLTGVCRDAGIDPSEVGYVEAHGTGTPTGDNREIHALAQTFARHEDDPLLVGSVKGTVGHLEGAAGLAGLIKTCLILHHHRIPPTANHHSPRKSLARLPLEVPTAPRPWPASDAPFAFAVVSSLGFSGSNASLVVTDGHATSPSRLGDDGAPVTVPLSSHTPQVLRASAADLAPALGEGVGLAEVGSTLAHRRDHHPHHRAAVVAHDHEEAHAALGALADGKAHPAVVGPYSSEPQPQRMVWAFAGHGTQIPGMGRLLYQHEPTYAAAMDEVLAAMAREGGYAGWHPAAADPPWGVDAIQQAIFATQVAQGRLLGQWGLGPEVVVGHSVGEIAAAHLAGALSLEDAARVVCARSRVLAQVAPLGGMLATGLSLEQAHAAIAPFPELAIAAENGPWATVITGPKAPLQELHGQLEHKGVRARRVADDTPAHSWLLEERLDAFAAAIAGLRPRDGAVELVSTVTGAPIAGHQLDADYWARQLRDHVQFHAGLVRATHAPCLVLEVASAPVLHKPMVEAISRHALPATLLTSGTTQEDEASALHAVLAECYARGLDPAWPHTVAPPVTLPPPRWHHTTEEPPGPALDLDTVPAEELPGRLVEDVHVTVAALAPTPITDSDRDTPVAELGVNSLTLLRLRAQLAGLHPAIHDAVQTTTIDHTPTIHGIAKALVRILTPHSS